MRGLIILCCKSKELGISKEGFMKRITARIAGWQEPWENFADAIPQGQRSVYGKGERKLVSMRKEKIGVVPGKLEQIPL